MASTVDEVAQALKSALIEYVEAAYHIADPALLAQRRTLLEELGVIHQAPFLESTPRYKAGVKFRDLPGMDPAALRALETLAEPTPKGARLFYDPPYTHQGQAVAAVAIEQRSAIIMTGTGSGKTESFLMPVVSKLAAEAKARPEVFREQSAVRSLILYPMNALVNDQLGRLRAILGDPRLVTLFNGWAGRPPRFARYTSRTPYAGMREKEKDQRKLKPINDFYVDLVEKARSLDEEERQDAQTLMGALQARGKWPAKPDIELWYKGKKRAWQDASGNFQRAVTLPDDSELLTRHEAQASAPDLLVTNYSMLEYMLMRPVERTIFDQTRLWLEKNPREKFLLILDESHLYRGAAGAEVGLLIRRLRDRLQITVDRMQVICATASFDKKADAPEFASKLTGVPAASIVAIDGQKLERPGPAAGASEDADVLAALDMSDAGFYSEKPQERAKSVEQFLKFRGENLDQSGVEPALLRALKDYPPLSLLVNHTMGQARPVDKLGLHIFPKSVKHTADVALTNLAALAANARTKADDPSLLPCRVHMFFRGLRGLWACLDPNCTAIDPTLKGVAGKLYAQPRELCDCFARVYEFFTCRVCGTAYARGYTDNPEQPQTVWSEPGAPLKTAAGELPELGPLDIMLTEPSSSELGEPAYLDLLTGRINPELQGSRMRLVYLSPDRTAGAVVDDDEGDSYIAKAGTFKRCGLCERKTYQERSPVQNHETKGDQPFQVLLGKQLQVQPPGPQPATQFAPLRGRKVLAFSDSRQVAARLAPNLQLYSARDSLRPLMVRGWSRLAQLPNFRLQLDDVYTAILLAAGELEVRLRPELAQHETFSDYPMVSARVKNEGILDDDEALKELCTELRSSDAPQTLLADIVSALRDRALGLEALGFASIVERADKRKSIEQLPNVPDVATDAATKVQLARAWLRRWNHSGFWLTPKMGAHFYLVHPDSKVRVKARSHAFQDFLSWLPTTAARQTFKTKWLPELLTLFTEKMETRKHRLIGRYLSLEFGGSWVRCADCKSVHRPVGHIKKCQDCGHETVQPLDPDTDEVFAKRKGYYRRAIKEALGPTPQTPLSLIAAEHTAQLNAAGVDSIFSKSEENELLFQDVEIPHASGRAAPMAIDVLSSTTTMEVGIDIGQLSGVALRTMPPGRANYQQRAGRAGRRGNAIATVVAFSGSDTHDEHYFSQPQAMISGPVVDPTLTLNNLDIARRHVRAFLVQTYHQHKIPAVAAGAGTGNLFSVLGDVDDFLKPNSVLSRDDFEKWMKANEKLLRDRVSSWIPGELAVADRETLLKEMVADTMNAIDVALYERTSQTPNEKVMIDPIDALETQAETQPETDEEKPAVATPTRALLDTLLYKGVLPRYAFPTDVATFHIFNVEKSTRFRPELEFAPGQSRNVALSQYAPGKLVWVAGKCYTSGAIYAPFDSDRRRQWADRRLYLECTSCGYSFTKELNQGIDKGQSLDCDACKGHGTLGPARYWMRPVGFAHPVDVPPVVSPEELPPTSYATRARLTLSSDDKDWTPVTERIRYFTARTHLLVSNTGPATKGYSYCTGCGRIEATSESTGALSRPHRKPYPDEKQPNCPGYTTEGIVLGTDFITDVALFSLRVDDPIRLSAGETITQTALRTLAEALARAACDLLGIEPGEVQAEYRPALSQEGKLGYETEIFLYDTLPGGAGFAQAAARAGRAIFDLALQRMTACPEGTGCDLSCYRCLRTFRNRIDHSALDRHTGRALIKFLLNDDLSSFDERRLRAASRLLFDDLERQTPDGWVISIASLEPTAPAAGGEASIEVVDHRGRRHRVVVRSPLEDLGSMGAQDVTGTPWASIQQVSELTIRKNLPEATRQVLRELAARE